MNLLLVHPRFLKTVWSFDAVLELVGRRVLLPPLGLITAAAPLPPTWLIRLVDCKRQNTRTSIPVAMLGVLQALPNTALWHRLDREGRLIHGGERFDEWVQTDLVNFRPTRPMPEVAAEFTAAFTMLYKPQNYPDRVCMPTSANWRCPAPGNPVEPAWETSLDGSTPCEGSWSCSGARAWSAPWEGASGAVPLDADAQRAFPPLQVCGGRAGHGPASER